MIGLVIGLVIGVLVGLWLGQQITEFRIGKHAAKRGWQGRKAYRQ